MSLGNLAIKVIADVSGFTSNMDLAAQSAQSSMGASSGSVDDFRTSLLKASADMQAAALAMGGNMQAANDSIMASATQSADAINGIADAADGVDTRTMGEKIGKAVGVGFGVGVVAAQSAWQTFSDWIEFRAKVTALAIAAAFAVVGLGAVYTAYKLIAGTMVAIAGMIDGTFYKSENIDALIKSNDQLKDLQSNLHISAIEAGGLNEAMKRLGVNPVDYKTVYAGITSAIHSNGDELDRLGVKYKDVDGKLLDNRAILQNAKTTLDAYTDGWDRNKAAAAIGMGTYEQITDTLKVTTAEVETSKQRLDDYQLGISAGTQDMVTKYQTAMREFSRETDLMGEGFKRIYADAVMPAYTAMANMMQEGWPSIVRATRIGVSTIVAMGYALADGLYIVKESIQATFSVIGNGLGAIAAATVLFMSGDLAGAKNALAAGWEGAKDRIKLAGKDIVAVVMANDAAIKTAIGADDRSATIAAAATPAIKGKDWVGKPDTAAKAAAPGPAIPLDDVAKRVMEGALRAQEDFIADEKATLQSRNEFLRADYANDLISATSYYGDRQRMIAENTTKTLSAYDAEIFAIEKYIAIHQMQSDKEADIVAQQNKIAEIQRKKAQAEIAGNREIALSYLDLSAEKTRIAQSFLKADEVEMKLHEKNLSVLTAFRDAKLENVIEGNRLLEQENKKHLEVMAAAQASNDLQALSQAASVGDQMLAVLKGAGQEKTAMYKALFLVNKAIAVAEILINTEAGAAKALGMGPFGIPMATIIRGLGYTSAGIAAGVAIASAEGGFDIPAGTNPVTQLHEKEMVLPKAQADVVRGLARNGGASSNGAVSVTYAPVINIDARSDQAQVRQLVSNAVAQGNANLVDRLQRDGTL
jgi:hypothetical protein